MEGESHSGQIQRGGVDQQVLIFGSAAMSEQAPIVPRVTCWLLALGGAQNLSNCHFLSIPSCVPSSTSLRSKVLITDDSVPHEGQAVAQPGGQDTEVLN